ncbi:MAG: eukaryotic-like serine/threonine-protein kinase [Acidobacteriota bacterium]|jgi:serine/threonine protein kinase|nr:eukaryotic-like serine/threonine-protein kinase [Acidobacteriota bacterium]
MPLAPETVLQSRYRIIRKLGEGGMGSVYLAIDGRFDSEVAIKETHFADETLRKQFEREARLLNKLRHPAMTRVIDHFTENDGQFLVMDYVEGDDLADMLEKRGGAFTSEEVLQWADQLLDALSYLHQQNPPVIHRDIKPQNLKLSHSGQIILLDFGLAKGFAGQISRVTTSGSIFGYTPNYAPLEQVHGTGTDPRSDLYSLAATMYKLLTNFTPSDVSTRAGALIGGRSDTLRPASEVNPQLTAPVSDVLRKGMAIDAEQRFSSAAQMRQALKDASQFISFSDAKTIIRPRPNRLPLRTVGIVMAWIGIALISGYFIYTFISRSRSRTNNPANIYTATANTSTNTSIASTTASNSNQSSNMASPSPTVTPSPSPSPTTVINLEGTDWKGKKFWDSGEAEIIFNFRQNGRMQVLWKDGDIDYSTWTRQGDKVLMNVTGTRSNDIFSTSNSNSNYTITYKLEGTIQGDEMSGEWDYLGRQKNDRFTVRIIK